MATNLPSCFFIQFLEQILKFLVNFTLLKYVKSQRSYDFLFTKEVICGFQILDLKDHFSASLITIKPGMIVLWDKMSQNLEKFDNIVTMTLVRRHQAVYGSGRGQNSSSYIFCPVWLKFGSWVLISILSLKIRYEYDLSKEKAIFYESVPILGQALLNKSVATVRLLVVVD